MWLVMRWAVSVCVCILTKYCFNVFCMYDACLYMRGTCVCVCVLCGCVCVCMCVHVCTCMCVHVCTTVLPFTLGMLPSECHPLVLCVLHEQSIR